MATYVIGDIQGCYLAFRALLDKIGFSATTDHLWLAGDLVNRGPDNLSVLRFCRSLGERIRVVLGNHDLHLLAADAGVRKVGRKDTIQDVLNAPDKCELLDWLRHQDLLIFEGNLCMSHAGVPHIWSCERAQQLASEVEQALRGPQSDLFFQNMYGNKPSCWEEALEGWTRLRVITNYLTRMRFISAKGTLDFDAKEEAYPPPKGKLPWFDYPRPEQDTDLHFLFGHWAALEGETSSPQYHALDTGCIWGGRLTALRLDDMQRYSVPHTARPL